MTDVAEYVIQPKTEGKGRVFRAMRVSAVMADALWDLGAADKHDRPVCATFVASEGEIRPFVANLMTGRPAIPTSSNGWTRRGADSGLEFMKSVGYKVHYQRHEEGTVATVYLPDLLALDPGMVDPKGVKFVVIAGRGYLAAEAAKMPIDEIVRYARRLPMVEEENESAKDWRGHVLEGWEEPLSRDRLAELVSMAYLHALYLSNRSRAPIPPDGRFYLQILLGCLKRGLASWPAEEYGRGSDGFGRNKAYKFSDKTAEVAGMAEPIAFMADHSEVEACLAEECEIYFRRTEGKK